MDAGGRRTYIDVASVVISDTILFENDSRTADSVEIGYMGITSDAAHREWLEDFNIAVYDNEAWFEIENRDTYVAPSGRMMVTSASSTEAPGIGVQNGTLRT